MSTAPDPQQGTRSQNPAKSWKILLLFVPMIAVTVWAMTWSQGKLTSSPAPTVHPPSAADGKVHVVSPQAEVDSVLWDGEVSWHPYPNAASYEVQLFREPGHILWKETSTSDRVLSHTEAFPAELRYYLNHSTSVGYNVIARDAKGQVVAESGPTYFYLKVNPQLASQ